MVLSDNSSIFPLEIGEPSPRLLLGPEDATAERNLIDEVRTEAHLAELALKQRMSVRYNEGMVKRHFEVDLGKGAYELERLNGCKIPKSWNAANLRRFYP
ncbi:hypothetical protein PIB30_087762 [Stylosanthes scabra]|uniref:Uncharacterized protein n=1 Tax=Stylosanthes scabra TaxID=79078 RepID=A0ABU6WUT1_9FABA|nr:hypothetical protein [Stylosanthes scabra]